MTLPYESIERAALGFALEDENWPHFLRCILSNPHSVAAHQWAEANTDPEPIRKEWLRRSDNPILRAIGEEM